MEYKLEEIGFSEFFIETKDILKCLIVGCSPKLDRYFKIDKLYFSLNFHEEYNNLHINMMAGKGSIQQFALIEKFARDLGVDTISLNTSVNNDRVKKLAEYYKFRIIKRIENFYPDGSECIVCLKLLDLD